jgi:AcrR family transcriptional regulator
MKSSTARAAAPYHHGNLREALLQAADNLLAQSGSVGLSLRDVARAAGVSHAAPYHHFASLDHLLAAVAERGFDQLAQAMQVAMAEADTRERLLQIAEAYVRCALAHPVRFRLMFGPLLARKALYPNLAAASQRAFGLLSEAACAHDPRQGPELALTGWSLSHGLASLMIDGALDGLPFKPQDMQTLPRRLAERALSAAAPAKPLSAARRRPGAAS